MCPETTTPERLLRQYEQGRLTAHGHLRVLSFTGKQRLHEGLGDLPPEILEQLKDFIAPLRNRMRVLRGPRPRMAGSGFLASADQTDQARGQHGSTWSSPCRHPSFCQKSFPLCR